MKVKIEVFAVILAAIKQSKMPVEQLKPAFMAVHSFV